MARLLCRRNWKEARSVDNVIASTRGWVGAAAALLAAVRVVNTQFLTKVVRRARCVGSEFMTLIQDRDVAIAKQG